MKFLPLVLILGVLAPAPSQCKNPPQPAKFRIEIDSLGLVSLNPLWSDVSPNARHFAMVEGDNSHQWIVYDGKAEKVWDLIADGSPTFSPDGEHLAYAAQQGSSWFVVCDGKPGPGFDGIAHNTIIFSPDSKHLAYGAGMGGHEFVVEDGKRGPDCYSVARPRFSSDSKHFYYEAAVDSSHVAMCLDGKKGPACDDIIPLSVKMSPDNERFAYAARFGQKVVVILDGIRGPEFDDIGMDDPVFDSTGKHLAYAAVKKSKWLVVLDGKEGPEFDAIGNVPLRFSPDGRRFAYAARNGNRWMVVIDGKIGQKSYPNLISGPVFSPESDRLAYGVVDGDSKYAIIDGKKWPAYSSFLKLPKMFTFTSSGKYLIYVAIKDGELIVMVDGRPVRGFEVVRTDSVIVSATGDHWAISGKRTEGKWAYLVDGQPEPDFDQVGTLWFSDDGTRHAYLARVGNKNTMVVDGVQGPLYDGLLNQHLQFSPDGKHLIYGAIKDNRWMIVSDGIPGPTFDAVGRLTMSPDGRHVAYNAATGKIMTMVLDGQPGIQYDHILIGSPIFDSDSTLRFLVFQGPEVLRVRYVY